jgi:hypothetical protein
MSKSRRDSDRSDASNRTLPLLTLGSLDTAFLLLLAGGAFFAADAAFPAAFCLPLACFADGDALLLLGPAVAWCQSAKNCLSAPASYRKG